MFLSTESTRPSAQNTAVAIAAMMERVPQVSSISKSFAYSVWLEPEPTSPEETEPVMPT